MIMDACVLIDFLHADRSVFQSISHYVGPLYVVSSVVEELRDVQNSEELIALGISVIVPKREDVDMAASKIAALSFQDWLCLLTAKRHGLTCVTNDKRIRRQCEQEGVSLLWGLELLLGLHEVDGITKKMAETVALGIHQTNPLHISRDIFEEFRKKLRAQ
jgi:predicted nucleic acid-binding protein